MAASVVVPSSSNWYCSRSASVSRPPVSPASPCFSSHFAVFSCHRFLSVFDLTSLEFSQCFDHGSRISCLECGQHEENRVEVFTAADGGEIRRLEIPSKTIKAQCPMRFNEPSCVASSALIPGLVAIGDRSGFVRLWLSSSPALRSPPEKRKKIGKETEFSNVFQFAGLTAPATAMAFSPSGEELAVSSSVGEIIIFTLSFDPLDRPALSVKHRLQGHEQSILQLAWRASSSQGSPDLLASSGKDKLVKVWNISTGQCFHSLNAHKLSGPSGARRPADAAARVWVSIAWIPGVSRPQLLFGGSGGEMNCAEWSDDSLRSQPSVRALPASHSRPVFDLLAIPAEIPISPQIPAAAGFPLLFSTSMDRQLCLWDLRSFRCLWRLPTIGGYIYSLAVNGPQLAAALGDRSILVWNGAKSRARSLWQGIHGKVTALSWKPDNHQMAIAYGTETGQVGLADLQAGEGENRQRNFPTHKGAVYDIAWRKIPADEKSPEESLALYSLGGDHQIFEFKLTTGESRTILNEKSIIAASVPKDLPAKKSPKKTGLAWHSSGRFLVVGYSDGGVRFFESRRSAEGLEEFSLLAFSTPHSKLVNFLKFHPSATGPLDFLVACSSDDATVSVIDFAQAAAQCPEIPLAFEPLKILSGHAGPIKHIAWCPQSTLLCTSSYDGTAQVWETLSGAPIRNLRGHDERLLAVCWDEENPDRLYTGGEDQTIRSWSLTGPVEFSKPPTKSLVRPPREKKLSEAPSAAKLANAGVRAIETLSVRESPQKAVEAPEVVENKKLGPSILSNDPPLAFFSSGEPLSASPAFSLLNSSDSSVLIWRGDVGALLARAVESENLTGALVAMSASLGKEIFLDLVKAWCAQMEKKGEIQEAAQQLICHGFVQEAILLFLRSSCFADALALLEFQAGQLKKEEISSLASSIYSGWALWSFQKGKIRQAICCLRRAGTVGEKLENFITQQKGSDEKIKILFKEAWEKAENSSPEQLALALEERTTELQALGTALRGDFDAALSVGPALPPHLTQFLLLARFLFSEFSNPPASPMPLSASFAQLLMSASLFPSEESLARDHQKMLKFKAAAQTFFTLEENPQEITKSANRLIAIIELTIAALAGASPALSKKSLEPLGAAFARLHAVNDLQFAAFLAQRAVESRISEFAPGSGKFDSSHAASLYRWGIFFFLARNFQNPAALKDTQPEKLGFPTEAGKELENILKSSLRVLLQPSSQSVALPDPLENAALLFELSVKLHSLDGVLMVFIENSILRWLETTGNLGNYKNIEVEQVKILQQKVENQQEQTKSGEFLAIVAPQLGPSAPVLALLDVPIDSPQL